jgi:hypothetical protein
MESTVRRPSSHSRAERHRAPTRRRRHRRRADALTQSRISPYEAERIMNRVQGSLLETAVVVARLTSWAGTRRRKCSVEQFWGPLASTPPRWSFECTRRARATLPGLLPRSLLTTNMRSDVLRSSSLRRWHRRRKLASRWGLPRPGLARLPSDEWRGWGVCDA